MKQRICSQCAHGVCDPGFWVRQVTLGWPATLMCVNTPEAPGQLRPVSPNGTCRNFVTHREPSYRLPPVEPATGDIRFIPLTQGKFAIVDAADYEWLAKYNWNAMTSDNMTYAFRKENGKVIFMHREIMKPRKGQVVDHINHNGADNRRSNMRNCSTRENACNGRARRNSSSQYRGVSRHGKYKWCAKVGYLCVQVHVGSYAEEIEAARAHDRMAIQLHGQYAYLNFPEEWPSEKREALYNSPEAVQARAEAKKRSAKLLRRRKAARRTAPPAEGRKVRGQEGKSRTRKKHKSQPRPDPNPHSAIRNPQSGMSRRSKQRRPQSGRLRPGGSRQRDALPVCSVPARACPELAEGA